MAEAKRDGNFVTTLLAVSSVDGLTPVTLYANPTTHRLLVDLTGGGGTGDVVGPTGATNNAIARFDTTTGKLLKNSSVTISDTGAITVAGLFTLPIVDGSNLQVLQTNGAGVVAWGSTSTGTVTTLSVAVANGFSGTVATPTTTPAITLTTTITGILQGNGTAISAATTTGTGSVVLATSPTLVTPILGVATATTINKVALTAPATGSTLTILDGKTLTANNSLTLLGTDATTMTFPTTTAVLARTDAAQTFTGVQTMTSPAITTPVINGLATGTGVTSAPTASTLMTRDVNANTFADNFISAYITTATAGATTTLTVSSAYYQFFTGALTQTVTLPVATTLVNGHEFLIKNTSSGNVTVNSSGANLVAVVAPGATLVVTCILNSGTTAASWNANVTAVFYAGGKTLAVNNSLTLAGTDNTTITFQGTDTYVGRATTDTLTNKRVTRRVLVVTQSTTPAMNTDNADIAQITALAQAITSMTTSLTGTPAAGDYLMVQITDNGTARAITWGASFASTTVTLPTTTVVSTMLRIGFQRNNANTVWDCIATA